jgi:hypothetical protein
MDAPDPTASPSSYPPHDRLSGLIINRSDYPKLQLIDSGAVRHVWRTVDARTGCPLALKDVNRGALTGDGIRDFGRAVEIMASARHETLLGLRGYSPIDAPNGGPPSILMDFVSGGSLQIVLDTELHGEALVL